MFVANRATASFFCLLDGDWRDELQPPFVAALEHRAFAESFDAPFSPGQAFATRVKCTLSNVHGPYFFTEVAPIWELAGGPSSQGGLLFGVSQGTRRGGPLLHSESVARPVHELVGDHGAICPVPQGAASTVPPQTCFQTLNTHFRHPCLVYNLVGHVP